MVGAGDPELGGDLRTVWRRLPSGRSPATPDHEKWARQNDCQCGAGLVTEAGAEGNDAVDGGFTVCRSLTWANAVTWRVFPVEH
jgi:hypothetical protein